MRYPVWIDGSESGRIAPADRGLAYGDGLFETLRIEQGRPIFLGEHFERLAAGTAALGIALDCPALLQEFLRFLAECPSSCVAKVIVTRGVGGRGYLPEPDAVPTRIFSAHPLPSHPATHEREGIRATTGSLRLAIQPCLAGYKHLNRLEQVLLRRELAELDADEALVCDTEGRVVEGVFSNVFLVRDGALHTPRIDAAGVRGVMRTAILNAAAAAGNPVHEGHYAPADFLAADEVFFCNSVNGVWPVSSLYGRHWTPGPITRQWQAFWLQHSGSR